MIKKRLLQLAAAGIISLILSFSDYGYPCDEYIVVHGYSCSESDPDCRRMTPHIGILNFHPPTDTTIVNVGKCIYQVLQDTDSFEAYVNGEYMTEIDAIEMINY